MCYSLHIRFRLLLLLASLPAIGYSQFQFTTLYVDTGMYVTDINIINDDSLYVCSGTKMLKTTDGGVSWDTLLMNTSFYQADFFDYENGYAVSPIGFVIKTVDAGLSWDTIQNLPSYNSFYDVHMINDSTAIVSADSGLIYTVRPSSYSVDTLFDMLAGGAPLIIKDFDFESPTSGFGGGFTNGFSGLARTVDGGNSWDVRATGGFFYLRFDEIASIDTMHVWGIEDSPSPWEHVLYSTDGGYYWDSGFPWFSLAKVVSLDFIHSGFGIVAKHLELFYSIDSGMNWSSLINLPSGFSGFSKIKIVNDSLVYVGTRDAVMKLMYPLSVGGINFTETHLTGISLSPNPVIDNLKINCQLQTNEHYKLSIFDLQGHVVFENDIYSEETVIDVSYLNSGCYFISIVGGTTVYKNRFIKV